jgi:hypothetical protein
VSLKCYAFRLRAPMIRQHTDVIVGSPSGRIVNLAVHINSFASKFPTFFSTNVTVNHIHIICIIMEFERLK